MSTARCLYRIFQEQSAPFLLESSVKCIDLAAWQTQGGRQLEELENW